MDRIQNFIVDSTATIKEAFVLIDKNHSGTIFVVDGNQCVVGVATDGDIRRWLLENNDLDAPITKCMNTKFVKTDEHTSRENLLKLLDHPIKVVPVLSREGRMVDVYTRDYFPLKPQDKIFARAKSPVRISFGGGGTDLTHYFLTNRGAVINSTISLYSRATLRKREDKKVIIYSHDLKDKLEGNCLADIESHQGKFCLLVSLLKLLQPDFGFELEIGSEFPMGSGLGGSAVVLSAIIGCFNQFREDQWDRYEIAEIAFQAERITLDLSGGWQDQYATVFGGFNFMEFSADQNIVHPLRVPHDVTLELEESLILCDVGGAHKSGDIHKDQKQQMQLDDVKKLVDANRELTYKLRDYLLRGNLIEFGKALHEAWKLKRKFSSKISSEYIDSIYSLAMNNGAIGGKLLGAGGGGFIVFYVEPFRKYRLLKSLGDFGLKTRQFVFDYKGLQSWTFRADKTLGTLGG